MGGSGEGGGSVLGHKGQDSSGLFGPWGCCFFGLCFIVWLGTVQPQPSSVWVTRRWIGKGRGFGDMRSGILVEFLQRYHIGYPHRHSLKDTLGWLPLFQYWF